MTTRLRAVWALALLTGLYLLLLVLALVVPGLVAIVIVGITLPDSSPWQVSGWSLPPYLLLLVATLMVDWAILRGIFAAWPKDSRIRIRVPDGELLEMVSELAKRIGTAPPKRLYLYIDGTDANDVSAEVRKSPRCRGFLGWTRTMDIGLPLLAALSPDHLRVVLGHELGHYAHTRLTSLTYRGRITIWATLNGLGRISASRRPAGVQLLTAASIRLLARYAALYLRISTAVTRRHELRADAQAARAVQETLRQREVDRAARQHLSQQLTDAESRAAAARRVTAEALLLAYAVPDAWADFLDRCPTLMPVHRHSPDKLFIAFRDMITSSGYQQHLARFQQSALDRPAPQFDPYPSLKDRLCALGFDAIESVNLDGQSRLLNELQPHLTTVARSICPTGTTSAVPAKIPDTAHPEHPGAVVRIEPNDDIPESSQMFRALAWLVNVVTIITIVVWLWHIASSPPTVP